MKPCRSVTAARLFAAAALFLACAAGGAVAPARAQTGQCPSRFDGTTTAPQRPAQSGREADAKSAAPFRSPNDALRMYVFGDSVMWGAGLRDRNKFWCRVKNWVEDKTDRIVKERVFAHSGATILPPPGESDLRERDERRRRNPFGEVNVSYPTVMQQVEEAVKTFWWEKDKVDLVLVDGCINDVDFRNMLKVENSEKTVESLTECKCKEPMAALLDRVTGEFPNARIVVTGYFPIVFEGGRDESGNNVNGTSKNALVINLMRTLGKRARQPAGGECPGFTPPAPNVPVWCRGKDEYRACLARLSQAWYRKSNEVLAGVVERFNRAGERRVLFAEINFPPDYGFSTLQSMLWNVGFGATNLYGLQKFLVIATNIPRALKPNDERTRVRAETCQDTLKEMKRVAKELEKADKDAYDELDVKNQLEGFKLGCTYASLGHPNKYGSVLYAQAITSHLQTILPQTGWKKDAAGTATGGDSKRR